MLSLFIPINGPHVSCMQVLPKYLKIKIPVHGEKNKIEAVEMSILEVEDELMKLKTAKEKFSQQLAMPGLTPSQLKNLNDERNELMGEVNYLRVKEWQLRNQLSQLLDSQPKHRADADKDAGSC